MNRKTGSYTTAARSSRKAANAGGAPQGSDALIAPGFKPEPSLNLKRWPGRILADMQFLNVYCGPWGKRDMSCIDRALCGAMTDSRLNSVIQQYFARPLTTNFLGSVVHEDDTLAPGTRVDRDGVDRLLAHVDLDRIDTRNTVICLYLPPGVILDTRQKKTGRGGRSKAMHNLDSSLAGLAGYHGSTRVGRRMVLYAVAVYSQKNGTKSNGIPFWPSPWKNVVATMYHELCETRTNPDVENVARTGDNRYLGWYTHKGGEIGDMPLMQAGMRLGKVLCEVRVDAGGKAPVQLMWCNEVAGPRRGT